MQKYFKHIVTFTIGGILGFLYYKYANVSPNFLMTDAALYILFFGLVCSVLIHEFFFKKKSKAENTDA